MREFLQAIEHPHMSTAWLAAHTVARLTVAAILGGVIGLERQLKHKPAGLRTNMFICFGAAMFTILSNELAGEFVGDHTRIAAQIIPGIGFIGAGSILHSRGSVTGLTTAATLFVVASIGMAVGGGFYVPAIFATMLIFLALQMLGYMETRFNLKPSITTYEVKGDDVAAVVTEINRIMEEEEREIETLRMRNIGGVLRVQFGVDGTRQEQSEILRKLRTSRALSSVEVLGREIEE
jgi:putative Mg2+ transporter-C (MgtC) family protein